MFGDRSERGRDQQATHKKLGARFGCSDTRFLLNLPHNNYKRTLRTSATIKNTYRFQLTCNALQMGLCISSTDITEKMQLFCIAAMYSRGVDNRRRDTSRCHKMHRVSLCIQTADR